MREAHIRTRIRSHHTHFVRGHAGYGLAVTEHGIDREVACGVVRVDELDEADAWSSSRVAVVEEFGVMSGAAVDRVDALMERERIVLGELLRDAYWKQ